MSLTPGRPLTPLEFAARRRNARKSTGPRSAAGKFRSSLNALKFNSISPVLVEMIRFRGEDIRAYRKMHRDLIALFLPQNLLQSESVAELAEAWWVKIRALRAAEDLGFREDHIREAEERIEDGLVSLLVLLRRDTRKWRYLLKLMLGETLESLPELRVLIESHLEAVTEATLELAKAEAGLSQDHKRPLIYSNIQS